MGSRGAGAEGWELSSGEPGAMGEPFGVGVLVGVNDDAIGEASFFISALSKISSKGETTAGFGDTKSTTGDLVLVPKTLSKSVQKKNKCLITKTLSTYVQ